MRRAWKAMMTELALKAELRAEELRTGISLVRATEASKFEAELKHLVYDDLSTSDIRNGALILAKCGMLFADYEGAARMWALRDREAAV